MKTQQFTYQDLFKLSEAKELVLPNFQRDFVWKPEAQEHLLASFLVKLPIGSFLLLEGNGGEYASRPLCFKEDTRTDSKCYYLLDGQQRLSTIKNIFSDHLGAHDWDSNIDRLHTFLKYRWFLHVNHDSPYDDILGFSNLRFKVDSGDSNGREKVSKLLTLEPSDVQDSIVRFKINKTVDRDKFYHPGYRLQGSDFEKQIELAKLFARNSYIPLFDVLSEDMPLLTLTLKFLAQDRVGTLREIVSRDSNQSEYYLGHLEPNIKRWYTEGKSDLINNLWDRLTTHWVKHIVDHFQSLFDDEIRVPMIEVNELPRATSVFEYMNKGGTPLDNFDILVAKFARDRSNDTLYDLLENAVRKEFEVETSVSEESDKIFYSPDKFGVFADDKLVKPLKESFLNIMSLLIEIDKKGLNSVDILAIKKEKILKMERVDMEKILDVATTALTRSLAFLQFRCGIDKFDRFNYKLMLLPIATVLKDDDCWTNKIVLDRIEYWYWASLFSGWYREKQNIRSINDIKQLNNWVRNNQKNDIQEREKKIFQESNYSDLDTLLLKNEERSVPSAVYNGLLQYILSKRPSDFTEKKEILKAWEVSAKQITLNDHHLIPLGSARSISESAKSLRSQKDNILNSPLNRTFITAEANNKIGAFDISRYLPFLNEKAVYLHEIPEVPSDSILNHNSNDMFYENFLKERFKKIKEEVIKELHKLNP
jgi:hypothetical protein